MRVWLHVSDFRLHPHPRVGWRSVAGGAWLARMSSLHSRAGISLVAALACRGCARCLPTPCTPVRQRT